MRVVTKIREVVSLCSEQMHASRQRALVAAVVALVQCGRVVSVSVLPSSVAGGHLCSLRDGHRYRGYRSPQRQMAIASVAQEHAHAMAMLS